MTLHDMLHRVPVLKPKARPQEDFAGPLCSGRALGGTAVALILTLDVTQIDDVEPTSPVRSTITIQT